MEETLTSNKTNDGSAGDTADTIPPTETSSNVAPPSMIMPTATSTEYVKDEESLKFLSHTITKRDRNRIITLISIVLLLVIVIILILIFSLNNNNNNNKQQNGEYCTFYHPQYPYHGGGACSASCLNLNYLSPGYSIDIKHYPNSFSSAFVNHYRSAGNILNTTGLSIGHGPFKSNEPRPMIDYDIHGIHMTLDYFCCYSPIELLAIDNIIKTFNWPPIQVGIEKLICTINEDEIGDPNDDRKGNPNNIELMLLLDEQSQNKLLSINEELERLMKHNGLIVNVPRSKNIGFHITLAHVEQTQFPVNSMIEEINNNINWSAISMTMFNNAPICPGPPSDKANPWNITCIG